MPSNYTPSTSIGVPSWTVEGWVRDRSSLKGTQFLVSLIVASLHSSSRGYAFPALDLLASRSRVSLKTAQRATEAMKESGEWTIVSGRGGRTSQGYSGARANRYYPTLLLATGESPSATEDTPYSQLLNVISQSRVRDDVEKDALIRLFNSLPEPLQHDFALQAANPREKRNLSSLAQLVTGISAGIDLELLIRHRIHNSQTPPRFILPWLRTWGLASINQDLMPLYQQSEQEPQNADDDDMF